MKSVNDLTSRLEASSKELKASSKDLKASSKEFKDTTKLESSSKDLKDSKREASSKDSKHKVNYFNHSHFYVIPVYSLVVVVRRSIKTEDLRKMSHSSHLLQLK